MFESLLDKVADFQDCCKTYILQAHLRFYLYLGKTLKKNFIELSMNYVLLKNGKCTLMVTKA